jgi:hypothetical protein
MRYLVVIAAVVLAACSHNPIAPTAVPEGLVATASSGANQGRVASLGLALSCDHTAPSLAPVGVHGTLAEFHWTAVQPRLVFDIVRVNGLTTLVTADEDGHMEWRGPEGHYLARAHGAVCGRFGAWSNTVEFYLGGDDSGEGSPVVLPVVDPPLAPLPSPVSTQTVFTQGNGAVLPLAIPAGTYRLTVRTFDAGHRAGYQTEQTAETLDVIVNGVVIGRTTDIPEDATSVESVFTVTGPATTVTLRHTGGVNSVHGAWVGVSR